MPQPKKCQGCRRQPAANSGRLCRDCEKASRTPPLCAECGETCAKTTGADIYPQYRHLADRIYWQCGCGAYVGSHEGSGAPLGTAAGPELRQARKQAHNYFDRIWRYYVDKEGWAKFAARQHVYGWLAGRLGLHPAKCHIAMFDKETCQRVVEACQSYHFPESLRND